MRSWSIATRFFVGLLGIITALVTLLSVALYLESAHQITESAERRMLALSTSIALNPFVIDAAQGQHPSDVLQPYAVSLMELPGTDFVTIMAPDGTRYTHRNPDLIGQQFIGHTESALNGVPFTEIHSGSLGPSIRAVAPIYDDTHTVIGLVATGVTVAKTDIAETARVPLVAGLGVASLVAGALLSFALSRSLNRATLGRGPEQISQMYIFYDAVLHAVAEGMLLVDRHGSIVLHNDEAGRLLGLVGEHPGVEQVPQAVADLIRSGASVDNQVVVTKERILVVSQRPAVAEPRRRGQTQAWLGTVLLLRDRTDVQRLSTELDTVRTMADALRAQTHEHANRLHTLVTLCELGRAAEAIRFATEDMRQGQRLTDQVMNAVNDPALAALLMGKTAQANERGIELSIVSAGTLPAGALDPYDTVTILGNLIDNAMDAAAERPAPAERWVEVELMLSDTHCAANVLDSGTGLAGRSPEELFQRGYSTKAADPEAGSGSAHRGVGLALVAHTVHRLGGTLVAQDSPTGSHGARFSVTLPLTISQLRANAAAAFQQSQELR